MIGLIALVAVVALVASFIGAALGIGMVFAVRDQTDTAVDEALTDDGPLDDMAAVQRAHALWIETRR